MGLDILKTPLHSPQANAFLSAEGDGERRELLERGTYSRCRYCGGVFALKSKLAEPGSGDVLGSRLWLT
ncbi:MAG: hypothetical protein DMG24_08610 [Acidobacteria bacterium]|nr:MAG: hypothetical protein DMG24_08610 [Acidobacteriota bacterium]